VEDSHYNVRSKKWGDNVQWIGCEDIKATEMADERVLFRIISDFLTLHFQVH
jgi:hypothetical protein